MNNKKIAIIVFGSLFLCIFTLISIFAVRRIVLLANNNSAKDLSTTQYTLLSGYQTLISARNQVSDNQTNVNRYDKSSLETNSTKTPEAEDVTDNKQIVTIEKKPLIYTIKSGDTLTKISARTLFSVDEIANFNQIRNVNMIYTNSALRLPNN